MQLEIAAANENPPRISPGGPHVVGAITVTSTSVVNSSVASDNRYIVVICDLSMTSRLIVPPAIKCCGKRQENDNTRREAGVAPT
jgi:hypothetical protein